MKDGSMIRCVSLVSGVALIGIIAVTGVDGDYKATAAAMIAFGLGLGLKDYLEKKKEG